MRIREYQLDKIEEARRIQQECLRLHMPCPPVLHWGYEIKNKSGGAVEIGQGKANSYTRNALNILACNVAFPQYNTIDSFWGNGHINFKNSGGTVQFSTSNMYTTYLSSNSYIQNVLGTGGVSETGEEYKLNTKIASGWTIPYETTRVSSYDSNSKKFITSLVRGFRNDSGSDISINESGIEVYLSSNGTNYGNCLMVYDVFDAISVASGETITWTYTTEVAYPNP